VLETLMTLLDERMLVVTLVSAERELNLKALAAALGATRAAMADIRRAERASGYVKGGISPFGQRQPAPAVVDASIRAHRSVLVNGGALASRSSSRRTTWWARSAPGSRRSRAEPQP
jgi:Cys-tRNA(Pro)/Cys-tRNA(Cys) deacylase